MGAILPNHTQNNQMLLSSNTMNTLQQRFGFHRHHNSIMDWLDLGRLLSAQTWKRMVKPVETETQEMLVICGLYRIVKIKKSEQVKLQRKTLRLNAQGDFDWRWVNTHWCPEFPLQTARDHLSYEFQNTLKSVVEALLVDLTKQGVNTIVVSVKAGKTLLFSDVDSTPRQAFFLDIRQKWARQWLTRRLTLQFSSIAKGVEGGSRALYKHLWPFVDRRYLSLHMKIHQTSLKEVTFKDVYQLSRHRFDVSMFEQNSTWLPWLKKIPLRQYCHPNLFSYEVLHPLLDISLSKKSIRRINQQPRKVQVYLIQGIGRHEQYLKVIKLLQKYPPRVVLNVFEVLHEEVYWRVDEELQTLLFPRVCLIIERWADYFMPMVGKVKVRKQKEQWQRVLIQLKDVLGWLTNTSGQVHKNQTWYSLMQQHERWIEQLNAEQLAKAAEIDALTWEGVKWVDFDTQGIDIKELTTGLDLRVEGGEMEHCVFSYLNDCVRGRYRVFSLRSNNERATLGLYRNPVSQDVQYDQLRGARNELSSAVMGQVSKTLIKQINASEK